MRRAALPPFSRFLAAPCLLAVGIVCLFSRSALAESYDERYLQGLRARRQFESAEKYCANLLADNELSETRRAELTIELSRTFAEHAAASAPAAQPPLWAKARQVVDQFAAEYPRHSQFLLIRVQGVLAALAQGELEREEADLAVDSRLLDEAGELLHKAIIELRKLDSEIAAEIKARERSRRADPGRQLGQTELTSLQLHVRSQLARGLRSYGLCFPPSSADRINALSQAIELLSELALHDSRTALAWSSRLDEIACLRLSDDYPAAAKRLAHFEKSNPPPASEGRLRAERMRLALARGEIDDALSEAARAGPVARSDWADVHQAQLETYLAARARARLQHDDVEAARWEQTATRQVRAIESLHGNFWMRKAETLLARSMAESAGSDSTEALVRAAEGLYRGGHFDEALAAYDRAAVRARDQHDKIQAFEIAYTAATVEKQREHYRGALDRYHALSLGATEHSKAGEAHLLAIYCAARLSAEQKPPRLDEYERLLREHLNTWPKDSTASQAWCWLGRLKEHEHALQEAIKCFRNVQADHPQYAVAVEAAGRCYAAHLAELRHNDNANVQLAKEAARYFEHIAAPAGGPPGTNPAARAAVLAAASLWLKETPDGAQRAERILNAALADPSTVTPQWQGAARSLLVPAVAAQGRIEKAEELLKDLSFESVESQMAMIDTLAEVTDRAAANRKSGLARLQLGAITALMARAELDPAATLKIKRLQAATLAEAGWRDQAIEILESLAKQNPRDGQTQEEIATLLSAGEDRETLEAALAKWREVASKSRSGSSRWFRAQYGTARAQLDLDKPIQARSTIKLVESAHPDFGGREMKSQFQKLLTECERGAADLGRQQK